MTSDHDEFWTSNAIESGDIDAIKQRLLSDPDFVHSGGNGDETPLLTAVGSNETLIVKLLLDHGADPNDRSSDGYNCLLTAVESEWPESTNILKLLLDADANVHAMGIHGWAPLHMAAGRGMLDKARLLIEAGAEIDQRTEIDGGITPLMEAATGGRAATVRLMLEHGADAKLKNLISQETPLEMAQRGLKGADADVYDYLKSDDFKTTFSSVSDLMHEGMPPEHLKVLEQLMANFDMAEHYRETANSNAEHGEFAKVIQILKEDAQNQQ